MRRFAHHLYAILFSAALLGVVPAAHAVDGTVLINQSTSVSGLPGCPHSGFPIVICQSGSYRLSGNLTVTAANTDAIDVTANGVTIDLNGFSIIGPLVCSPDPNLINCPVASSATGVQGARTSSNPNGAANLTVTNGAVGGWFFGIFVGVGTVEKINASNNATGIFVENGIASHNVATGNIIGIETDHGLAIGNFAMSNNFGLKVFCPSTVVDNAIMFNASGDISLLGQTSGACVLANNVGQ